MGLSILEVLISVFFIQCLLYEFLAKSKSKNRNRCRFI